MRVLKVRTSLGLALGVAWSTAACNPETDLQKDRAPAAGTEGGDGRLSGAPNGALGGQLVDPAIGTSEVPTNLATVVLAFPEAVALAGDAPGAWLQAAGAGAPLAMTLGLQMPCSAQCYAFAPTAELTASTAYTVKVPAGGLQFPDGKPVPAAELGVFTTGAAPDLFAPRVQVFTIEISGGCATVHVTADEQAHAEVIITSNGVDTTLSSTGTGLVEDFSQRLPELAADSHARAVARVVDRSGNPGLSAPLSFALPGPVPRVVITEVLANPAGAESTQEFVEIYNAGDTTVELGGWWIEDKTGKDVLPEAMLMPGEYRLIVGETFNPADGKDPAPASTAILVRVPGRIGSDGLSNSGELVRLATPDGQVVSQYGGWVDASATAWSGKSTRRLSTDACDAADAWSKTPGSPTPGW